MSTTNANERGLGLLDLAIPMELVSVGESKLKVYGLSAEAIIGLFSRFPEMKTWFKGGVKPDLQVLISEAPFALAAVIASGCGHPDDESAEAKARGLPVEAQVDVLEAVWRLTFKNGFGPFVERIVALAAAARSENLGRAQDTRSPKSSKPSSPRDTEATKSGE